MCSAPTSVSYLTEGSVDGVYFGSTIHLGCECCYRRARIQPVHPIRASIECVCLTKLIAYIFCIHFSLRMFRRRESGRNATWRRRNALVDDDARRHQCADRCMLSANNYARPAVTDDGGDGAAVVRCRLNWLRRHERANERRSRREGSSDPLRERPICNESIWMTLAVVHTSA